MDEITLTTSDTPDIRLTHVGGDLRLSGWEQNFFQAEPGDTITAEQRDGEIWVNCREDAVIRLPRRARVKIEHIGGDAKIKTLDEALTIEYVGGDLVLRQVATTTLQRVQGDLSAKKVQGALQIKHVQGDASARSVTGDLTIEIALGDIYLREVGGNIAARSQGDLSLNVAFKAGNTYTLEAGGDLQCRVPDNASARLTLQSGGSIEVTVPTAQTMGSADHKEVTLGNGEAPVTLQAGGDIAINSLASDPDAMGEVGAHFGEEFSVMAEEFSAQIETQIEAQMADFSKQLAERLGDLGNLGTMGNKADEIAARARRAAERAAETAQRKAERASEAAQRKAEKAERRSAWTFQFGPRPPTPPTPPRPPMPPMPSRAPTAEPISNEERMAILKMVEQGTINVADAEKLLAALDGKA